MRRCEDEKMSQDVRRCEASNALVPGVEMLQMILQMICGKKSED